VYDESYVGSTNDPSHPPIPFFSKGDEIHHVAALKRDANVVSVFVDLGSPSNWQRLSGDVSDPPGSAVIQISSSTIRIEDVGRSTTWETSNQIMEYAFIPTVTAPGDTLWKVVRWVEIAN
jgi:hypothetical protein